MLETVRQYAQEKLAASDEADPVRTRHLDFFLGFATEMHPQLWGKDQAAGLARVDLERENLLAAHGWCDRAPDGAAKGLRLVDALQLYWLPRGLIELGYRVTVEAAARTAAQPRDDLRAGALYAASQLAYFMGAFDRSKEHGLEALAIAEEIANPGRAAAARQIVGHACQAMGELAAAREHFEASVALARAMGRKDKLSFALNSLAGLYSGTNDFEAAEPLCAEALALARELDDRESVALGLAHLGSIVLERGDADSARKLLDEGISVAREIGSMRSGEYALEVVRGFAIRLERWAGRRADVRRHRKDDGRDGIAPFGGRGCERRRADRQGARGTGRGRVRRRRGRRPGAVVCRGARRGAGVAIAEELRLVAFGHEETVDHFG